MAEKKLLMIVNPRAGRNKSRSPLYDAIVSFSNAGYLVSVQHTTAPGDATRIALESGAAFETVVAVGGDGTLNEVLAGLLQLENKPNLGYLPQGSTNDFAASLHISNNPALAAEAIVRNEPRTLDLGLWNGRSFVYVASFGAFTRTSYTASQDVKNALGHLGYLLEGVKNLDTLRPYHVRITADGEKLDGSYLFGAICNSTSIAGMMKLSEESVDLTDGKFEMLLIPEPKTVIDLQNLIVALLGQQYHAHGLIFRHVSQIHVETDEDLPWSLDGEYAASCPEIEIENRQCAFSMLL